MKWLMFFLVDNNDGMKGGVIGGVVGAVVGVFLVVTVVVIGIRLMLIKVCFVHKMHSQSDRG